VVAIIRQRTWTNGKARSHLSCLERLPLQLCELETHIRISRNLKKFVDLIVGKLYHSTGGVLGVLGMLRACCGPKFLLPT